MIKNILALFLIISLIAGCDKNNTVLKSSGPGGAYPIETQPSLSLDRQYIYYINTDTTIPANDGIYRVNTATAERERLLTGSSFASPTISPDNLILAFLFSGTIVYYDMANKEIRSSEISNKFASITFFDDTLLAGQLDSSIFVIKTNKRSVTPFFQGWDPVASGLKKFAYVRNFSAGRSILKVSFITNSESPVQSLGNIATPGWPSIDTVSNRFTCTLNIDSKKFIIAGTIRGETHMIDSTNYPGSVIVSADKIIFTGPDGRFYVSDFAGKLAVPFVAAVGQP